MSQHQKPIYPRDLWHHDRWGEFQDDQIVDWKRIRAVIEHENQLINHRITWLLVLQGALITWSGKLIAQVLGLEQCGPNQSCPQLGSLLPVALFGSLVSIFISITLSQAEKLIQEAVEWWKDRVEGDASKGFHPPLFPPADWVSYSHKYSALGWLFSCFWGAILIGGIFISAGLDLGGANIARVAAAAMLLCYFLFTVKGLCSKDINRRSLSFLGGVMLSSCLLLGFFTVLKPIAYQAIRHKLVYLFK